MLLCQYPLLLANLLSTPVELMPIVQAPRARAGSLN